jgi:hypothetical protein
MRKGFHINDLPATSRDAVLVTRALNQRYLWIDSLCIIQKGPLDWAKQSSLMGDIYANSYLTLAATTASDDCAGFLTRDWGFAPLNIISSTSEQTAHTFLKLRQEADSEAPLLTRAWTLQEQLLSPRVIHFQKEGLHWDCLGLSQSEVSPEKMPILKKHTSLEPVPGVNALV